MVRVSSKWLSLELTMLRCCSTTTEPSSGCSSHRYTSSSAIGQIYIPTVNRLLMLATIGLVLGFRSSSNLAVCA